MRFLIVNTDYVKFIADFYREHPSLALRASEEQFRRRFETLFGMADFYSAALRKLGHEARDVILNLAPAQRQWAKEHILELHERRDWRLMRTRFGWRVPVLRADSSWMLDVLAAQVRDYRPDVLYCMCLEDIGTKFIERVRPFIKLAVGQHAAPHSTLDLSGFDLIFSSLPNYVEHFRARGMPAELLKLGFAPRVLSSLEQRTRQHEVVFIGGISEVHDSRTRDLERFCTRLPIKVWGYGSDRLPRSSAVAACHQGLSWGRAMYQTLADAKIVFNQHVSSVAGPYANNMRLYEATGVGSLLLTDWKQNLAEMFEPEREVATFRTIDECLAKAEYFLRHDDEREEIARRGQQRTLRDHTYEQRMSEMVEKIRPHFERRRP